MLVFCTHCWHAHNCEWTSSLRIFNISCGKPFWEFQLMIRSSFASVPVELGGAVGWLDLGVKITPVITPIFLPVSLFVCLFVRLFVFLQYFNVILNVFVFFIHYMLKCQNKITIDFVEGHPSSLNIITFCQVFLGPCSLPCSSFHEILR